MQIFSKIFYGKCSLFLFEYYKRVDDTFISVLKEIKALVAKELGRPPVLVFFRSKRSDPRIIRQYQIMLRQFFNGFGVKELVMDRVGHQEIDRGPRTPMPLQFRDTLKIVLQNPRASRQLIYLAVENNYVQVMLEVFQFVNPTLRFPVHSNSLSSLVFVFP